MAADWVVTYQNPKPNLTKDGRFEEVVEIHYRVLTGPANGHEDMVVIPQNMYTDIDHVKTQIESKVAANNAVAGL